MDNVKTSKAGMLEYGIFENRIEMGKAAADHVELIISALLSEKKCLNIIFAAAPSQNEMLENLTAKSTIDWSRINAFHMDEYLGLEEGAEQLFSKYLYDHLFSRVNFRKVFVVDPQRWQEYAPLIKNFPPDIVCMGIGENGHIAFNDPPVADFEDKKIIKEVELDLPCRTQQVNDGCFESIDLVPKYAVTLTIPVLMSASYLSIVVPGKNKAAAVAQTVSGEISTECPGTILRTHKNARMFLDTDSASLIGK